MSVPRRLSGADGRCLQAPITIRSQTAALALHCSFIDTSLESLILALLPLGDAAICSWFECVFCAKTADVCS